MEGFALTAGHPDHTDNGRQQALDRRSEPGHGHRTTAKENSGSRRRHGHRTKGSAAAAGEDRGEARPGHMGAPSIRFFRRQGRNSFSRTKKATQQIMLSGCF